MSDPGDSTRFSSVTSLETPPSLDHAFLFPLKASMVIVRSCDGGLEREKKSKISLYKTNLLGRRKSLSVSDIPKIGPKTTLSGVPENNLQQQVTAGQVGSHSPLNRPRVKNQVGSTGRLTPCKQGGSFGDLINSGEFKNIGSLWSVRSHSPITLSMVSVHSDSRPMSPLTRACSPFDPDDLEANNEYKNGHYSPAYSRTHRLNVDGLKDERQRTYPSKINRNLLSPNASPIIQKYLDPKVKIAVEAPCSLLHVSKQQSVPLNSSTPSIYEEMKELPPEILRRGSSRKLNMKERTLLLSFLIHRQQKLSTISSECYEVSKTVLFLKFNNYMIETYIIWKFFIIVF